MSDKFETIVSIPAGSSPSTRRQTLEQQIARLTAERDILFRSFSAARTFIDADIAGDDCQREYGDYILGLISAVNAFPDLAPAPAAKENEE